MTGTTSSAGGRWTWVAGGGMNVLLAATFAQAGSMVSDQGIPVLLPFIKHDLNLSLPAAALLVTTMGSGRFIASLPVGQLVDRIGSRAVLGGTCVVLSVVLGLASLANSLPLLVVLLVAAGAATAGTTSAGAALVARAFASRRGLAMGIRQSGVPLGGLIGGLLLPWIATAVSWHWAIAASAAFALAGAITVYVLTTDRDEARSGRPALGLVVSLLKSKPLIGVFVWGGVFVVGQYSFITLIAVQEGGLGLGVLMVTFAQLGGALGRPAWGLFSDLIGQRRRLCMLLISAAAVACTMVIGRLQPSAGPGLLGAFAFAFGIAMIGWQGLWATSISEITGPGQAGTALGIGQMFIQVGIVAGPAILALIIERGGFNFAWTALGVALLVATLPLLLIRNWPVEGRFAVRA